MKKRSNQTMGGLRPPNWAPAKEIFAVTWALFKLACIVRGGLLKWWAQGHFPNVHKLSPPLNWTIN